MPVDSQHPEYKAYIDTWRRCRAFADGEDAVKAQRATLLPMLDGQDEKQYLAYLKRAGFFGATGRTIAALLGAAFTRDPVVEASENAQPLLDDIDLDQTRLVSFARNLVREQLTQGRVVVLIDYSEGRKRPYMVVYKAEDFINWRVERLATGERILRQAVLREAPMVDGDDEFEVVEREQFRVLDLVGGAEDGGAYYRQRVFVERKQEPVRGVPAQTTKVFDLIQESTPQMRGQVLRRIPLVVIGALDLTPEVDKPPLLDLVNANWHHYRLSADHDHGLHWVSLPTPWVSGLPQDIDPLYVGSSQAWALPEGANVGMLEVGGAGFSAQHQRLDAIEQHMQALGSRLLGTEKAGVEAEGTVHIRLAAEDATLSSIINTANQGLNQALAGFSEWAGLSEPISITVTTEFAGARLAQVDAADAMLAYDQGKIGWEELVAALKNGGLVKPETDPEELRQRIAANPPPVPQQVPPANPEE